MRRTMLRVAGRLVPAICRIGQAGEVVGLGSRASAYRMAVADRWPMVGSPRSRYVLMIPLLERYGIPFEIVGEAG
jgi:hypothetical protein